VPESRIQVAAHPQALIHATGGTRCSHGALTGFASYRDAERHLSHGQTQQRPAIVRAAPQ